MSVGQCVRRRLAHELCLCIRNGRALCAVYRAVGVSRVRHQATQLQQRLTPHRSPMKAGKAVTMSGMSGAVWSGWAAGAPPFAPSGNASAAPALPPELSRLWRDATPTKSAGRG